MIAMGLNAPFGARCFLTPQRVPRALRGSPRLNAPFGARCFLTVSQAFAVAVERS